jgi:hypothetical protein
MSNAALADLPLVREPAFTAEELLVHRSDPHEGLSRSGIGCRWSSWTPQSDVAAASMTQLDPAR